MRTDGDAGGVAVAAATEAGLTMANEGAESGSETRRWATRGGLALVDQFLQSGSNFVLAILLARALPGEGYGLYAVSFSLFLLLATLYQGAVLVPCTLLATTHFATRQPQFFRALLRLHAVFSVLCAVVLGAVAGLMFLAGADPSALAGPAVALPGVLLYWLGRTCCYVTYRSARAVIAATLYAAILFTAVGVAAALDELTAFSCFAAMSLAGFAAGAFLMVEPQNAGAAVSGPVALDEVIAEGWKIGRWELAVAAAIWVPANLCYPLTAGVLGVVAAGQLRALQNFVLPMAQGLAGLLRLAQPYFSSRGGGAGVWRMVIGAMGSAALYLLAVTIFREPLMEKLYNGKFAEATPLLPWMVLSGVLGAGVESLAVGLRALRGSRDLLGAYLVAALIYAAGGVPLARWAGLSGVVAVLVFASAASLVAAALLLRRLDAGRTAAAKGAGQ